MTTAGVATELKWTRKFSENFIETDSSARVRQRLAYVYYESEPGCRSAAKPQKRGGSQQLSPGCRSFCGKRPPA
jgi:hypothetical protein